MTDSHKIALDSTDADRMAATLHRVADQIDGTPGDTPLDMIPESRPSRVLRFIADGLRGEAAGDAVSNIVPARRAEPVQR
jgi:hypothetical protein